MKRPLSAIACSGFMLLTTTEAMVSSSAMRTSSKSASLNPPATTTMTQASSIQRRKSKAQHIEKAKRASKYSLQSENEYDEDEDEDDNDNIEMEVHSFQELQRSAGPEILDADLQLQIDQASDFPNLFLDAHVTDASYMEKVAMASIPEQLPRPAVNALRKSRGLEEGAERVSPEEEIELAKMIQQGAKLHSLQSEFEVKEGRPPSRSEWAAVAGLDSAKQLRRQVANYRRAKQLLVSANIGLVHAVVRAQYGKTRATSGVSFEELVQEGSLGLLRAAELFDPNRGLRFSTYATIWIKGQLSNSHVGQSVRLPQREKTKWNKINQATKELIEHHGRATDPTVEELAELSGLPVSEVLATKRKMTQVSRLLSLDYEFASQSRSGEATSSYNALENDKNFQADADLAERTQMQADLVAAMARNLSAREARLMRLRYGLADGRQRTLAECADAMGISHTYAQNLASKCLKKLREASEAQSLEEYFLTIA